MTREERNRLVEENLGLVKHVLRKYKQMPNWEDIFMEGVVGMIDAIDRMKDGSRVSNTYVCKYILGYALTYVNRVDVPIVVCEGGKGTYKKIKCLSIEEQISADGDKMSDLISDVRSEYVFDDVITRCDFEMMIANCKSKYASSMMLFFDGCERTEIAKDAGISYEWLRQNIAKLDRKYITV